MQVKQGGNCRGLPIFDVVWLDILMQTILVLDRIIMLTLDVFPAGRHGVVDRLELAEEAMRRVAAFGLAPGCRFYLRRAAPLGGPLLLDVGATRFLLRRSLARFIVARVEA